MSPLLALAYSFMFGLLHGILPDEHTWPITFSYAVGGASGREGLRAGVFFSTGFTVQRALLSELAYLALAPFLITASINGIVYIVVGVVMSAAGAVVVARNRYIHLHLPWHHHEHSDSLAGAARSIVEEEDPQTVDLGAVKAKEETEAEGVSGPPPVQWALIHGFLAGFGFGGFSLFVNTVAAPAMPSPLVGFLPGLLFGIGTMIMLLIVGALFGASLRWSHRLTESEVRQIGAQTGGRTLLFGGLLFAGFGAATLLGLDRYLPVDSGYFLIGLFMVGVAVPAFIYSWRQVTSRRGQGPK
ncbi:MAG: hypothetical protein ACYC1C_01255 [Chloroflexota bacterium]